MSSSRSLSSVSACVVLAGITLAGCGSSGGEAAAPSSSAQAGGPKISVVASTNVYGDIVKQIAGDSVAITSIISDPDQDPHSYEADTKNQLALSKADIVIANGGGYDDFVGKMLGAANNKAATVLDVVKISGKAAPAGEELNEHVWYDFPTVEKLTDQLVTALSKADSADSAKFSANAATFTQKVKGLETTEAKIKAAHTGDGAAITEPVPLYLLEACGLENKTPGEFSEAIEEGTDVPAAVLSQTLALFTGHQVKVLAYNEQTSGPETEKVLAAAKANNVAVVPVTETLPSGKDYLTWMGGNLSALESALG